MSADSLLATAYVAGSNQWRARLGEASAGLPTRSVLLKTLDRRPTQYISCPGTSDLMRRMSSANHLPEEESRDRPSWRSLGAFSHICVLRYGDIINTICSHLFTSLTQQFFPTCLQPFDKLLHFDLWVLTDENTTDNDTNKTGNIYVRVTIVAVVSNKYCIFWVCVSSLSYPARKAHAPHYIVICGQSGTTMFFHMTS